MTCYCQFPRSETPLQVLVWDVSTGALLAELRGGHGAAAGIRCIRLSPDGRTLASVTGGGPSSAAAGDGRVNVWSWRTGFLIASVRLKVAVHAVLFSNDGAVRRSGYGDPYPRLIVVYCSNWPIRTDYARVIQIEHLA